MLVSEKACRKRTGAGKLMRPFDELFDISNEIGIVKAMIDMRREMKNIKLQKQLETHLELQNANMFENLHEDYEEPDFLKDEESMQKDESEKENENSEMKEVSTESMEKVV